MFDYLVNDFLMFNFRIEMDGLDLLKRFVDVSSVFIASLNTFSSKSDEAKISV